MGSREIKIKSAIAQLTPAEFQSLAQELITRHLRYDKPTHRGSATNSGTTAPGTPDTYWILPEGHFAYLECGHFPDRNKALKKIEEDIGKCLATEKAELGPNQLEKIIIAYSCRRLTSADVAKTQAIDSRVELFGIDRMAMLLAHNYQNLAKEHLDISISSGQIMEVSDFIEKSERGHFTASLNVSLLGREHELEELYSTVCENQVTLLFGKPGCGKTRLAIEVAKQFADKNKAAAFVISSNGLPIWEDLATDIPSNTQCIIVLDDANDLSELSGFADFISKSNGHIKTIMTVRNYARKAVFSKIAKYCDPHQIELTPLDDDAACVIVEQEFGIKTGKASADIVRVSKGNMRLAYMASEAVKAKGIQMFSDMPELVESCYEKPLSNLGEINGKAARIVSILGAHKTEANEDLEKLERLFSISHQQYIDACRQLHNEELVDAYKDMIAVAPGDQVLRDYLLFKTICEETLISLEDIHSLLHGPERCSDIVTIVVSSFCSEEVTRCISKQIVPIWDSANNEQRWELADKYTFLIEDNALMLVSDEIDNLPSIKTDYFTLDLSSNPRTHAVDARYLKTLSHSPDVIAALELPKNSIFMPSYVIYHLLTI